MAYGQDRFVESATAFPVSRRYTSQVKDEDTGLYYYGARYYDPQLGRFIQPDTIIPDLADPQSLNRYSYVRNNPLKYIDPTGHAWLLFDTQAWGALPGWFVQDVLIGNTGRTTVNRNSAAALKESMSIGVTPLRDAQGGIVQPGDAVMQVGGAVVKGTIEAAMWLSGPGEAKGAYEAANTLVKAEKAAKLARQAEAGATKVDDAFKLGKTAGRSGKQERLRELAGDANVSSADRGWIKNEQRHIKTGNRDTIRNPPGKDLAHERGREAAKGYSYEHSNLQSRDLHRTQHKFDDFGRANKERSPVRPKK
jgi:RHS repeat-associated protein